MPLVPVFAVTSTAWVNVPTYFPISVDEGTCAVGLAGGLNV